MHPLLVASMPSGLMSSSRRYPSPSSGASHFTLPGRSIPSCVSPDRRSTVLLKLTLALQDVHGDTSEALVALTPFIGAALIAARARWIPLGGGHCRLVSRTRTRLLRLPPVLPLLSSPMSHQPYTPRPLRTKEQHDVVNRGRFASASLGLERNGLEGSSQATESRFHHQLRKMKQSYRYPLQLVYSSVPPTKLSALA